MLALRYYLWIAPDILCGIALFIAVRRHLHRRFPAFITLLSFCLIELLTGAVIGVFFSISIYRWWLVIDVAAVFLLEIFVLFEIAREALLSCLSPRRAERPLPWWAAAALIPIAAALAMLVPETAQGLATNLFQALNFALNLIVATLLLAMLLLTRILGISWRTIPAGIVLGFGVAAITEVASSFLMAELGRSAYIKIDVVRMIAFHLCALIWLLYVLLAERQKAPIAPQLHISVLQGQVDDMQAFFRQ